MIGKAELEIVYCVTWGHFPTAASVALELVGDRIRETDVKLTPAHGGRFEIYLNGEKIYDRKVEGTPDFVPFHRAIGKVEEALNSALDAAPATAGSH